MNSISKIIFIALFFLTVSACNNAMPKEDKAMVEEVKEELEKEPMLPLFSNYKQAIEAMRAHKNESMLGNGIIEKDDVASFKGLKYFAPDSTYIFKAKFELLPLEKVVFKTTDDRAPEYFKFCKMSFTKDGKVMSLIGYVDDNMNPKSIFVPFKDLTSNKESYGGGRYIDLDYKGEKTMIILDFNYAYNPYCHYNHNYSCPLVPLANNLNTVIKAGEMKLHE